MNRAILLPFHNNHMELAIHKHKVELLVLVAAQYKKGHIDTTSNVSHANIRSSLEKLDWDVVTITYCNKGVIGTR